MLAIFSLLVLSIGFQLLFPLITGQAQPLAVGLAVRGGAVMAGYVVSHSTRQRRSPRNDFFLPARCVSTGCALLWHGRTGARHPPCIAIPVRQHDATGQQGPPFSSPHSDGWGKRISFIFQPACVAFKVGGEISLPSPQMCLRARGLLSKNWAQPVSKSPTGLGRSF